MLGASHALLLGSSAAAQTYLDAVDHLDPVGHWPLNDTTNRKPGSPIAFNGSHEIDVPPIAQQDEGGFGRGFNGTDFYGTIEHNDAYEAPAGGVFVLMQPDTVAAKMQVFNSGVAAPGSMALEVLAGGQPRAYRHNSNGDPVFVTGSAGQIVAGTPYLYGVTWGPNGLRLWLMNAGLSPGLVNTTAETDWSTITDTAKKYLGRWSGSPIGHFDGVLGHLQFYGTELNETQIKSIALPRRVVWLGNIDAESVTENGSKFIDFAPHAHPATGFTPAVLSQPSRGTATAIGTGADYDAGATAGDNDTFTAKITAGGVDSRTAEIRIDVVHVEAAVDVGALSVFARSTINVTALAGWPSGRLPKAVLQQGARASAYIRRAWKPSPNSGTHMDFVPGWQKTTAQESIRLQLDDHSEIDLTYTVGHTTPSPGSGGVIRTLDRTATAGGTTYNTWASAIAALQSNDVLVVRAPTGTWTDSGGHAIPNYVYDVTTSPAPAAGASNVTILAHPDDVAAGRRPVIWRNAGRYARFKYAAADAWQVHADLGSGRVIYQSAATHSAPQHSLYSAYRDTIGGWTGMYNHQTMNDAGDRSGVLHDTTTPQYAVPNNTTYMGPTLLHNRVTNRLEVRLNAPPKASYMNPANSPYPPWDWNPRTSATTDARDIEIVCTDGGDTSNWNYLINLDGRNGWKFYNLDLIYGNSAVNINGQSTPPQFFGCNFLGGASPDADNNGDDAQLGNVASTLRKTDNTTHSADALFDRCNLYGGMPPWGAWTEGKGNEGVFGISIRREIMGWSKARAMFRFSRLHDWYHFSWSAPPSGSAAPIKWHWHHCYIDGSGMDGGMVVRAGDTDWVANRNFLSGACLYGDSHTTAGTSLRHHSFNVDLRLHAMMCTRPAQGKWAAGNRVDYPCFVHNFNTTHAGGARHPDRKYYNTFVGSQSTYYNEGTNAGEGVGSNIGPDSRGSNHRSFNNIGAVYPSPVAWPGGWSSFVGVYFTLDGNSQYNHNHLFRASGMLSGPGSDTFMRVAQGGANNTGTNYADIAALRAGSGFEVNGTEGDPQFVVTPAYASSDPWAANGAFNLGNYLLAAGSPASTGARNLNDQSFPDYDFETLTIWIGGANAPWRGALQPDVPAHEQEVGIVGPTPPLVG